MVEFKIKDKSSKEVKVIKVDLAADGAADQLETIRAYDIDDNYRVHIVTDWVFDIMSEPTCIKYVCDFLKALNGLGAEKCVKAVDTIKYYLKHYMDMRNLLQAFDEADLSEEFWQICNWC